MANIYYLIDSLENKYRMAISVCDWNEAHTIFVELQNIRNLVPVVASSANN